MSTEGSRTSKNIASAAASIVDGYLRNASKRHRIPSAEGGRGTRRKLAMVTSMEVVQLPPEIPLGGSSSAVSFGAVDADDNEWDEIELPNAFIGVKKMEDSTLLKTLKEDAAAQDSSVGALKVDHEDALPLVKDEKAVAQLLNNGPGSVDVVKSEAYNVDDSDGVAAGNMMEGFELPLGQRNKRTTTWRRQDPAYETMVEQRDLLAAQRRSERIQRTSESVVLLLSFMIRARLLWRESHHLRFAKSVLRLCVDVPSTDGHDHALQSTSSPYVFIHAVRQAKAYAAAATDPSLRKLSLAPVWITCTKDSVNNRTSAAVKSLLTVVNKFFKLREDATPSSEPFSVGRATNGDVSFSSNRVGVPLEENTSSNSVVPDFSSWSLPIRLRFLSSKFRETHWRLMENAPILLNHPFYFCSLFLSLASLAGLQCRLVIAKQERRSKEGNVELDSGATEGEAETRGSEGNGAEEVPRVTPLRKMSIFGAAGKAKTQKMPPGTKRSRSSSSKSTLDTPELRSKKLPTSCFWVEVWSPERESFVSVNPCEGCTTLWGAPFTFSFAGNVAVDATPRYTSKFSSCYSFGRRIGTCQQHRFLWRDKISWDDNREVSEILREGFNVSEKHLSSLERLQRQRETKQLQSLMYSEAVPTTLNALHRHPLYVIESDLARHEGVHPKDESTTVGSVKGHLVFKRSAIVSLRSRDGWLREGRSLLTEDQVPYKTVAPPASRPFASPSQFFGRWQTKTFEPLPLCAEDGGIPHHGRTSWYVLLDQPPPPGIVHLTQPQIVRVARRMRLDLGLAVVGFVRQKKEEHRRGHWETIINGIVVKQSDSAALVRAYEEWIQLVQEQEAARRRQRAFHWWLLFIQRLLSMQRLQEQYAKGLLSGAMPST